MAGNSIKSRFRAGLRAWKEIDNATLDILNRIGEKSGFEIYQLQNSLLERLSQVFDSTLNEFAKKESLTVPELPYRHNYAGEYLYILEIFGHSIRGIQEDDDWDPDSLRIETRKRLVESLFQSVQQVAEEFNLTLEAVSFFLLNFGTFALRIDLGQYSWLDYGDDAFREDIDDFDDFDDFGDAGD